MERGFVRPFAGGLLLNILLHWLRDLGLERRIPQDGEPALTGMLADLYPSLQRRQDLGFRQCCDTDHHARSVDRPNSMRGRKPTTRTRILGITVGAHARC